MKYIFKQNSKSEYQRGELPIENIHVCWYDMEEGNKCFDENWINPELFTSHILTYLDTEENEGDIDRSRIFIHHKNGDIYELRLHKLTKEQWAECSNFYGGKDYIN